MAIEFNETDQWYSIVDSAELTLPDGDWCIGIWTRVSDNAGSFYQYLLSNNNFGINNSFNLYLAEDGSGGDGLTPGTWRFIVQDGAGVNPAGAGNAIESTDTPGADDVWRLIIVQRNTAQSRFECWFCVQNGTATLQVSITDAGFGSINGGAWNIGRRVDGSSSRYYGSMAAEFFKGDFALSQAQIEQLAAGLNIVSLGLTSSVYYSMLAADATLTDETGNGNTATRNGSPTTYTPHPISYLSVSPLDISNLLSLVNTLDVMSTGLVIGDSNNVTLLPAVLGELSIGSTAIDTLYPTIAARLADQLSTGSALIDNAFFAILTGGIDAISAGVSVVSLPSPVYALPSEDQLSIGVSLILGVSPALLPPSLDVISTAVNIIINSPAIPAYAPLARSELSVGSALVDTASPLIAPEILDQVSNGSVLILIDTVNPAFLPPAEDEVSIVLAVAITTICMRFSTGQPGVEVSTGQPGMSFSVGVCD